MRIDKYKCDLCGVEMATLENLEELELTLTSVDYEEKFTYYVCPFCAKTLQGMSPQELEKSFNKYIQDMAKRIEQK